jgi:hypothetical protein
VRETTSGGEHVNRDGEYRAIVAGPRMLGFWISSEHADQAQAPGGVGEDADYASAPADFQIQPFEPTRTQWAKLQIRAGRSERLKINPPYPHNEE